MSCRKTASQTAPAGDIGKEPGGRGTRFGGNRKREPNTHARRFGEPSQPTKGLDMGEVDNKVEQAKGHVKEAVGDLTDNDELRDEGKRDQAAGKVKQKVEQVTDKIEDGIDNVKDKVDRRDGN